MAELIAPPKTVSVSFSLEPAYNAIASLSLLDMAEDFTGLGEWVYRTAEALSPDERLTNRHVLLDAAMHLLRDASWPSFEAWVEDLAARDAKAMRDAVGNVDNRRQRPVGTTVARLVVVPDDLNEKIRQSPVSGGLSADLGMVHTEDLALDCCERPAAEDALLENVRIPVRHAVGQHELPDVVKQPTDEGLLRVP